MSDRGAKRAFLCSLAVRVYPLIVHRYVCERIDAILVDFEPFPTTDLFSDIRIKLIHWDGCHVGLSRM